MNDYFISLTDRLSPKQINLRLVCIDEVAGRALVELHPHTRNLLATVYAHSDEDETTLRSLMRAGHLSPVQLNDLAAAELLWSRVFRVAHCTPDVETELTVYLSSIHADIY